MARNKRFIGNRKRSNSTAERSCRTKPKLLDKGETVGLEEGLAIFIRAKEVEQVRSSTIREYLRHVSYLADYMTEFKGIINPCLDDITVQLVRDYIHYMLYERVRYNDEVGRKDRTVGLSPNTVNIRLRTLRTMSKFWTSEGLIEQDFMQTIKPLRIDELDEIQGLTDVEIDLLLNSYDVTQFAEYRDVVLIYLLLDTGLRITEATSLTIQRVDFRMMTIYVPSQIAKNRRNREVPVSAEVAKMLKDLYKESLEYFGESDNIFHNAYGVPFSAEAFRKRLNRRKEKLGMERLSPHMFRHTFGRNFLLNGGDIATLQRILDHADIETTRKYATMDMSDIKSQHNKYSPAKKLLARKKA